MPLNEPVAQPAPNPVSMPTSADPLSQILQEMRHESVGRNDHVLFELRSTAPRRQ